jgi:hypothetical protein
MVDDSNILDFSQTLLSALILIISAGVTAHIFHGYNNKKWRTSFIGLLLLMLICTQVYYLMRAVLYIPTYPYQYDSSLLRSDCLDSGKGGKRSRSSTETYDLNPCYFYYIDNINLTNNSVKPVMEANHYLSDSRNCVGGLGGECSMQQPCTPCDRASLPAWSSSGWGGGRCRTCSSAFRGHCNFVPGVGPYCLEAPDSKLVIPCKRCCTDGAPLIVNGTCY